MSNDYEEIKIEKEEIEKDDKNRNGIFNKNNKQIKQIQKPINNIKSTNNMDLVNIDKKKGNGSIVGYSPKMTNEALTTLYQTQQETINAYKKLENLNVINDMKVLDMYRNFKEEIMNSNYLIKYYNNNFHTYKWTSDNYENFIETLLPPLEWLRVSRANNKFLGVNHIAGTQTILKMFYPYCNASIKIFRNPSTKKIFGTNLEISNKQFPFIKTEYNTAPGMEVNEKLKTEKADTTIATKFSECFGFLRSIYYNENDENVSNLENLFEVMEEFKNDFYEIDNSYIDIFRYGLDEIAHFYIRKRTAPERQYFTLDLLKTWFSKDILYIKLRDYLFYTNEELENNTYLIQDERLSNNEFDNIIKNIKEKIIKENEEEDKNNEIKFIGEVSIDNNTNINNNINEKQVIKTNQNDLQIKKINVSEHLIPRDYFTIRNFIHDLLTKYIQHNIFPNGVNVKNIINNINNNKINNNNNSNSNQNNTNTNKQEKKSNRTMTHN